MKQIFDRIEFDVAGATDCCYLIRCGEGEKGGDGGGETEFFPEE